jgi:hypothetical protein
MKMETLFSRFRRSFSKLLSGMRGQPSTSQSSQDESCCKKYEKRVLDKMILLLEENKRLKEELRLRDLQESAEYDV